MNGPFAVWDWTLLNQYERTSPQPLKILLLTSVHEYVSTLYGALYQDLDMVPIPQAMEIKHPSVPFAKPWKN
jgi:hypothetical protein